jgi:HrpA-like RNA helicase
LTRSNKERPSLEFMSLSFKKLARNNKVFILLNALDETKEVTKIARYLINLGNEKTNLRILITSRHETNLQEATERISCLKLEDKLVEMNTDIEFYIDNRLETDGRLRRLDPNVKKDIAKSLLVKSEGMRVSLAIHNEHSS